MEKPLYSAHVYSGQSLKRTQYFGTASKVPAKFPSLKRTPHIFYRKNKNKVLFNFPMFLFDTLLFFSTAVLTLLYLVNHQEFHEFPELRVSQ